MGKDAVKADCHFSLVALMRRRKILPAEEAFHILRDAPEILESSAEDFAATEPLVNRIVIHFEKLERDDQMKELIAAPASSWPRFRLHLTPGGGDPAPGRTAAVLLPDSVGSKAAHLALLVSEMIGGVRRDAIGRPVFSPLSALNEEGNDLLLSAISGGCDISVRDIWSRLLRCSKPSLSAIRAAPKLSTPPDSGAPLTAAGFELEALDGGQPNIRFSSGKRFQIGRSRASADYPITLSERSDGPAGFVTQLSRFQAVLQVGSQGVTVHDGDGKKPSTNGTRMDNQPLDAARGRPLSRRAILVLGGRYRLELVPITPAREAKTERNELFQGGRLNDSQISQSSEVSGVFVNPIDRQSTEPSAVWLFGEAPFISSRDGAIVWTEDISEMAGAFCFQDGSYSIRAGAGGEPLAVNDAPLDPRETRPLRKGTRLQIGTRHYICRAGI